MVLRESAFLALLKYLSEHTQVLSPADLQTRTKRNGLPQVLLTFDDGWADNYEVASPHLAAFEMKACFFVVTAYSGCVEPFWPERVLGLMHRSRESGRMDLFQAFLRSLQMSGSSSRDPLLSLPNEESLLCWLKQFSPAQIAASVETSMSRLEPGLRAVSEDPRERLMTWEQMRSLVRQGHMIASHTCTHALLTRISGRSAATELANSRTDLASELGFQSANTSWISYPNGDVNTTVQAAAYNAGYRFGFTTAPGVWRNKGSSLAIPRMNLWDGSLLSPDGNFDEISLEHTLYWRSYRAGMH
ncbi:polysaccharide deacetylase family protein [Terriglobus tenax]|uniref:polysaccharide deacetylase family protein n=1 Tax=Terriglobus tenax TaxID=1111115 RepID=UPI0021E08E1A|nr:polysaccharide deacetylase family protein [Terriglobus tenax]